MTTQVVAADVAGIAAAVTALRGGTIVAVPTETVYGLAGDATHPEAVAAIYAAKGRPGFNPLIVHVADLAAAEALVEFNPVARALAARFWPGPLTLVLPLRPDSPITPIVRAGLPTLAMRVPAHPVMRAILRETGPLAAPSANVSGSISPTTAAHVLASLGGRIPLIVDGGACEGGIESSIVAVDGERVRLLRPGGIPADLLGINAATDDARIVAPGQMVSHYAPVQPVRLDAVTAAADELLIGFGPVVGDLNLSPGGDLAEAAANLFAALHVAQASGRAGIAVAPIPATGIGAAINDRLRRAAATRS